MGLTVMDYPGEFGNKVNYLENPAMVLMIPRVTMTPAMIQCPF